MRRSDREVVGVSELAGILDRAEFLTLAFLDGGSPALVPLSFGYRVDEPGKFVFYFHAAQEGRKIDCLKADSRASLSAVGENRIVLAEPACRSTCLYESIMALAIRELDVEGSPLNILLPIKGTPLEGKPVMAPAEAAKAFALFRLINPTKMIKFAAGRETVMKDFQGLLMLSGLNSLMTGGYLTTRGRSVEDDMKFIEQLNGF